MSSFPYDDWTLNPLLIAQAKSVRPEGKDRVYVDWFASPKLQICRRAKFPIDSAWNYLWSRDHWSWLAPPFAFCERVVSKFFRDSGRGTLIVPGITTAAWFSRLQSAASIAFRVHPCRDAFLPVSLGIDRSTSLSSGLWIFIIDDASLTSSHSITIPLAVHPDWASVFRHTPTDFKAPGWVDALSLYPDDDMVNFISDGIDWGHSLGFSGNRLEPRFCSNSFKATKFASELEAKIHKEYASGFRSGPFRANPPFFNILCHPRSAALKKFSNAVRLVINMSFPYDGSSVNTNCTPDIQHNLSLDQVGDLIIKLGPGTRLFKFDVCAAYKQIRLAMDDWHLQGEMFTGPEGVTCFDFCTAANFGARSSGFIWEKYGSCFEFALRWVALLDAVVRYVDDFLAFLVVKNDGHDSCRFEGMKARILALAASMGIKLDKFDEGTRMPFLGVIVDTVTMRFEIPPERLSFICAEVKKWPSRKGCTKRELQGLIGHLQYLTRIIPWGRAFIHRLIRLVANSRPPHAPVRISNGLRLDLQWWADHLPTWPGISLFFHSWAYLDGFEVDASEQGHGCYWHPHWYSARWEPSELSDAFIKSRLSMPYLELRAIAYACATFGRQWAGKKILCRSDCKSAVDALNNKYSRSPRMQFLIRCIGTFCLSYNFDIRAKHIPGLSNTHADMLSRLQTDKWICDQAPSGISPLATPLSRLPSPTSKTAYGSF